MRSVARRPQTGALLADNTIKEEMKKGVLAIHAENGFQADTRFSSVAGGKGTMPQHHHGMETGFLLATGHRGSKPSVWAPDRASVGGREGRQCAHFALCAQVFPILGGRGEEGKMSVTFKVDPQCQDARHPLIDQGS